MLLKGEVKIIGPQIKVWNFLPSLTKADNVSSGVKSSNSTYLQSSV